MNSTVLNLLAVWNRRPNHTLEFGVDEDWAYAVELMTAVKGVIPSLETVLDSVDSRAAMPPAVSRNPIFGVTAAETDSDAPTVKLGANEPWKPRWERDEVTNPILATVDQNVSTPNNVEPSAPAEAPNIHNQVLTQHTDGNDAANGQTPGTLRIPSPADARLAAARKVAATSKTPSSRARRGKRTKVTPSTLP